MFKNRGIFVVVSFHCDVVVTRCQCFPHEVFGNENEGFEMKVLLIYFFMKPLN